MRYMTDTIVKYILENVNQTTGVFRYVFPSYPPELLFEIGRKLDEGFRRIKNFKVGMRYGIAYRLGQEWKDGDDKQRVYFDKIRQKGWYNETDNLTSLRNIIKPQEYDSLVILLAGYEHISDQGSLQDFFHLDQQTIWRICLGSSFKNWVRQSLKNHIYSDDEGDFEVISDVLKALYEQGLASILEISSFLEHQDFSSALTRNDALKIVLNNMPFFKLPPMSYLLKRPFRAKNFERYIAPALEFFNYSMFLEERKRNDAREAIKRFSQKLDDVQPDPEVLGPFADKPLDQLLTTLEEYIAEGSLSAREKLKNVDFVYIFEDILKNKAPIDIVRRKTSTKKLIGFPPEVFLRAIWITLGDFINKEKIRFLSEGISKITLESTGFRHDFESDDGEDSELAELFLRRLLGGIDALFESHIQIKHNENSPLIKVESHLLSNATKNKGFYRKQSTAEPQLQFRVSIFNADSTKPFTKDFAWALPQNHQSRFLISLYERFNSACKHEKYLPVLAVPFLKELFLARDEESVNWIFGKVLGKECVFVDLVKRNFLFESCSLEERDSLIKLSNTYQTFVREVMESGFFSALASQYDQLRRAYEGITRTYLENSDKSSIGPLLMKAFMVVSKHIIKEDGWEWDEYLEGGVVTPLHPALLDMIRNQCTYLCESFCYYVSKNLEALGKSKFAERSWDNVVELANLKWPIFGIIRNANKDLDTHVSSYNYLHLVGRCEDESSFGSGLLLQDEVLEEDEEITDTDLFKETQSSQLIKRTLLDYRKLHKHADDGLCLGAYCGGDIQQIIAGIDSYLAEIFKDREDRPYSLKLIIFSDTGHDLVVLRWINAWKERWQQSEFSSSLQRYQNCDISISYRVISANKRQDELQKLLEKSSCDIMFFFNFIESNVASFEQINEDDRYPSEIEYRKFPVLEKIFCRVEGAGKDSERKRIISNSRFKLATLHSEVMYRIKVSRQATDQKHVIVNTSAFRPWIKVMDIAHQYSSWVVCIDPSVDEQLLKKPHEENVKSREIVGFGTGVGQHGECNFTISTEHFSLVDISKKIGSQIYQLFGPIEAKDAEKIAETLLDEAKDMAGLSIVKATGPSHYVRDYVAYALIRKLLPRNQAAFCDEVFSLDAFLHWFDEGSQNRRPDLLRLQAEVINGYFKIKAQVIECKIAKQSESPIEQARQQIEEGLKQLIDRFRPREEKNFEFNTRPDQRFWWMQLHRLIAGKGKVSSADRDEILLALERLSDGYFDISWQAAAVAFWTDVESDELKSRPEWNFEFEGQQINISVATAGKHFISKACLENERGNLFSDDSYIAYQFPRYVIEDSITAKETLEQYYTDDVHAEIKTDVSESGGIEVAVAVSEMSNEDSGIKDEPSAHVPERILLGSGPSGGREIFWEFGHPDLPNRHMIVFGASGTGKTYTIQALLLELAKAGQNSLIIDYTNGFTTEQLESIFVKKLNPKQHIVRKEPLPVNPFLRQRNYIDNEPILERSVEVARRVSDLFASVYELGDQQKAVLYTIIKEGIEKEGDKFDLSRLIERLEELQYQQGDPQSKSAITLLSKVRPFVDMEPFGEVDRDSWEKLFTDVNSRCHIIQLAGFHKDSVRLITEFSLFDFYWYYKAKGNKDQPRVVVLDEIQNLDHSLDSPLGQMLTEGRKFGISLILATQTMSNLSKDERDRLFQASHKLFFKPSDTEVRSFAQILSDSTNRPINEWVERLSSLKRGECYSLGPAYYDQANKLEVNRDFKIRIKTLTERL